MAELSRRSCRNQGKPPEYTPSQLEGLKSLIPNVISRTRLTEQGESSIITHPDFKVNQLQIEEHTPQIVSISELAKVASTTSELSLEEPEISKPETEPTTSEPTLEFTTPTLDYLDSPRVKNQITEDLPLVSLVLKKSLI